MHTLVTRLVVAALLALGIRPAAADVQISYLVEDKPLKAAVTGTDLSVELWHDPACTVAAGSATVAIDDVDLVERLKRFTPKGGVKGPAAARITESLPGVSPPTTLFATITGTGITPVGGACQLQYASLAGANLPCASQVGNEVYFTGCNVNVRDGSGDTSGTPNGLGNLVVGYNEAPFTPKPRTGSHNLIVGRWHGYSSWGTFLAGFDNLTTASESSVSGGLSNQATATYASVSGGRNNLASGDRSSVSGGDSNVASGHTSCVAGGDTNIASANFSTIGGGWQNEAKASYSSVSAGICNIAGTGTPKTCTSIPGYGPVVSGGLNNLASAGQSVVSGGAVNVASGVQSVVSGGRYNQASGLNATVSGGFDVDSTGQDDWDAGRSPAYHSDF